MTFKKPYRICNKAGTEIPGLLPEETARMTASLKELKDRYELRINIPGSGKRNYSVSITGGKLYICLAEEEKQQDNKALGCFILPADVEQHKVTAFYRKYGIKIILPIAQPDNVVIRVPVCRENTRHTSKVAAR